jgi:uncharacterized protein
MKSNLCCSRSRRLDSGTILARMPESNYELVRRFFAALSGNSVTDELFTEDMSAWTTSSGRSAKPRYLGGIAMLRSLFPAGLTYAIDSLTAEDDRVAAEAQSCGTLASGTVFRNSYLFLFCIRGGRIASIAEHFNPDPVRELIMPLLQAKLAASP